MRSLPPDWGRRSMACINTNDPYVRDYCGEHPEAERMLSELAGIKKARLRKYGLLQDGGSPAGLSTRDWFRKVKAVQVDLLRELKRVCDGNGLRLFLTYGSLLGAVRDGGRIDGDDDIDVALMREDYDALVRLAPSFRAPYFLQDNYSDDCFYGGYMKLRNSETTAIVPQNWYVDCNEGICIDIFPVDRCFGSELRERRKLRRIRTLQRLLFAKSYGFFARFRDMPLPVWKAYKYAGKPFSRRKLLEELDDAFRSHDGRGGRLCIYTHYGKAGAAVYMDAASFKEVVTVPYEGMDFSAPKGLKDVLEGFYGPDCLRPADRREGLHAFYRPDVPYTAYKERFTRLFTSVPDGNKALVVFGDAELFGEYTKRFPGAAYRPAAFIPCGDEGKPGELDRLRECDPASTFVVIAAFDFLSAEDEVRALGFRDYAIYVYDRNWLFLPDLKSSRKKYLEEKQDK